MESPAADQTSERELVRRARWGDGDAFAQLYRLHARAVHTLALRLTGNTAAAEDITQDVFLKMLQFLGGFHEDAPLRPWLKRVAANVAIDRLRRERPQQMASLDEQWPEAGAGPAQHAEASNLLRRLPPLVRTVVWLHEMEGWSHPDLARRFGRSQSWSKSVLSRGLARLRADLEGPDQEGDPHADDADGP